MNLNMGSNWQSKHNNVFASFLKCCLTYSGAEASTGKITLWGAAQPAWEQTLLGAIPAKQNCCQTVWWHRDTSLGMEHCQKYPPFTQWDLGQVILPSASLAQGPLQVWVSPISSPLLWVGSTSYLDRNAFACQPRLAQVLKQLVLPTQGGGHRGLWWADSWLNSLVLAVWGATQHKVDLGWGSASCIEAEEKYTSELGFCKIREAVSSAGG